MRCLTVSTNERKHSTSTLHLFNISSVRRERMFQRLNGIDISSLARYRILGGLRQCLVPTCSLHVVAVIRPWLIFYYVELQDSWSSL